MNFFNFFKNKKQKSIVIGKIYLKAVEQARQKELYEAFSVPDTVDGRFDMIILHLFLIIKNLKDSNSASFLTQGLLDYMFDDMDRNLREMGVGDLSVGKQVKKMAKAFYGRSECWEEALSGSSEDLKKALKQTIFRSSEIKPDQIDNLCKYIEINDGHIKKQEISTILKGKLEFLPIYQ